MFFFWIINRCSWSSDFTRSGNLISLFFEKYGVTCPSEVVSDFHFLFLFSFFFSYSFLYPFLLAICYTVTWTEVKRTVPKESLPKRSCRIVLWIGWWVYWRDTDRLPNIPNTLNAKHQFSTEFTHTSINPNSIRNKPIPIPSILSLRDPTIYTHLHALTRTHHITLLFDNMSINVPSTTSGRPRCFQQSKMFYPIVHESAGPGCCLLVQLFHQIFVIIFEKHIYWQKCQKDYIDDWNEWKNIWVVQCTVIFL